jgi:hypothetical protein
VKIQDCTSPQTKWKPESYTTEPFIIDKEREVHHRQETIGTSKMATQDGNLERSIQEIDCTTDHIAMLLATQTNDQERYELAEKIILELVNKNERLLKEKEIERKEQRVKIQTLEKQLEAVKEHSQANNIKNTTVFIHVPNTKANYRHFEHVEIGKYSNFKTNLCYSARVLKPKERAFIVDELTTARAKYPVTNYKDMRNTIHWLQEKLQSHSLHACANILKSNIEGLELYREWNTYWTTTDDAKIQSSTILAEILQNIFSKDNPVMTLKFHQANGNVPQDILGVYMYSLVRDQFPHATLDVIVHDIARVMMFSLQVPKYTTFDAWYRSFMQKTASTNY